MHLLLQKCHQWCAPVAAKTGVPTSQSMGKLAEYNSELAVAGGTAIFVFTKCKTLAME
jgi:hypothetical protein